MLASDDQCETCYWVWLPSARILEWPAFCSRRDSDMQFRRDTDAARIYSKSRQESGVHWFRDFWPSSVAERVEIGAKIFVEGEFYKSAADLSSHFEGCTPKQLEAEVVPATDFSGKQLEGYATLDEKFRKRPRIQIFSQSTVTITKHLLDQGSQAVAGAAQLALESAIMNNATTANPVLKNMLLGQGKTEAEVRAKAFKVEAEKKAARDAREREALGLEGGSPARQGPSGEDQDLDGFDVDVGSGNGGVAGGTGGGSSASGAAMTPRKGVHLAYDKMEKSESAALLAVTVIVINGKDSVKKTDNVVCNACHENTAMQSLGDNKDDAEQEDASETQSVGTGVTGASTATSMLVKAAQGRGVVRPPAYWVEKLNMFRAMCVSQVDRRYPLQASKCVERELKIKEKNKAYDTSGAEALKLHIKRFYNITNLQADKILTISDATLQLAIESVKNAQVQLPGHVLLNMAKRHFVLDLGQLMSSGLAREDLISYLAALKLFARPDNTQVFNIQVAADICSC